MRKTATFLTVLLTLALLLTACQGAGTPAGGKIELTDSVGGTVTLEKQPEKIVVFFPSDAEILYALGAQDRIAAVGEYCNYPPEISEKTTVGTGENTSVEQVIALSPDLVIIGVMAQTVEQTESLQAAGIPVYVSDAQTIEQTYGVIEDIGLIAGKEAEAAALIQTMKDGFDALAQKAEGAEKKSVYVEISPLAFGLFTCGSGTFVDELLTIVGADNAFGDQEGWAMLSEEQVIAKNPDVILTTSLESYGLGVPVEEIAARPGWDVLSAVQGGHVYQIDSDACTRPGPRLLDAAEEMSAAIYGS